MCSVLLPLGMGEASRRPRIKVVGVGGAGCNAIQGSSFESVGVCTSRDGAGTNGSHTSKVILSDDDLKLVGTTHPKFLASIEHDVTRRMYKAIGGSDLIFVFTGLGGETGTTVTPAVIHVCRKVSELVIVSATLPFSVESSERRRVAMNGLSGIVEASHLAITYPNDAMLEIAPNMPLRQAFRVMNDIMMLVPRELESILTPDDLSHVKQDFLGANNVRMGVGIAQGKQRWEVAVKEVFSSPWFDFDMNKVTAALVIITSDEKDPYMERNALENIASRIPNARIRYATRTDSALREKVRATVLLGTIK